MQLPLSIESLFKGEYNGLRAARFQSANEAHNLEVNLKTHGLSYQTKIIKNKRKGREFVVMLVEVDSGT